jgi:hypothetical protein
VRVVVPVEHVLSHSYNMCNKNNVTKETTKSREENHQQHKNQNEPKSKADKGNTLVIIHENEYNDKVEEFISQNNLTTLSQDITNKQQKLVRTSISTAIKVGIVGNLSTD